jgi:hypothetical protein
MTGGRNEQNNRALLHQFNGGKSHAARWSFMVHGGSPRRRHPDLDAVFLAPEAMMTNPPVQTPVPAHRGTSDYRNFMVRELLIWLVGVPVPIAAIIGFFVL